MDFGVKPKKVREISTKKLQPKVPPDKPFGKVTDSERSSYGGRPKKNIVVKTIHCCCSLVAQNLIKTFSNETPL